MKDEEGEERGEKERWGGRGEREEGKMRRERREGRRKGVDRGFKKIHHIPEKTTPVTNII